jgi:hypothetical protein
MRLKTPTTLAAMIFVTILLTACSAIARHHAAFMGDERTTPAPLAIDNSDLISGEWNVSFFVHDTTTPATFNLKLAGTKVTGTVFSEHTGPGTVREGKWADGKLTLIFDFKNHESIAVDGAIKDGKLAGEFHTEGFTAKWEAKKK